MSGLLAWWIEVLLAGEAHTMANDGKGDHAGVMQTHNGRSGDDNGRMGMDKRC